VKRPFAKLLARIVGAVGADVVVDVVLVVAMSEEKIALRLVE
jgi:hypothetical protein